MDEFASDLQQVIAGLLEASVNHSTVHRTAVRMRDQVWYEQRIVNGCYLHGCFWYAYYSIVLLYMIFK